MIRMAIPKGRLYHPLMDYLYDHSIPIFDSSRGSRNYTIESRDPNLGGKIIKARAIPQMVALELFDVGFCGLDLVIEFDHTYEHVVPILDLRLQPVTLVVAVHKSQQDLLQNPPKRPLRIATEYPQIASRWAWQRKLAHITIQTYGSTEGYTPDDADIVFDCCESGATIAANGLVIIDQIVKSTTWLIVNRNVLTSKKREIVDFDVQLAKRTVFQ